MVRIKIDLPQNKAVVDLKADDLKAVVLKQSSAFDRDFLFVPAGLGLLAAAAVFLGRGLAIALPGTLVGFDNLVNLVLAAGAFASQLFAIAGAVVSLRLALWLSTHRSLAGAMKAWLGASCLFVCLVVFFSAQPRLFTVGPLVLGLLSLASGGLLLLTGQFALGKPQSRALPTLLTLGALTALCHTAARLTALAASSAGDGLQFEVARVVATLGTLLDAAFVAYSATWLWFNSHVVSRAAGSILLACIPAVFVGDPESGPRYVAQRTADALTSHPDPFLPLFVQWGLECSALTLATVAVLAPSPGRAARLAVAFTLLGRTTSDRPLGALLLVLGALCLLFPLVTRPISGADHLDNDLGNTPGPLGA